MPKVTLAEKGDCPYVYLGFYCERVSAEQVDLVIDLDGQEVVRKPSVAKDFSNVSAKAVIAMAMSKRFDGENCYSRSEGTKNTVPSSIEGMEY